MSDMLVKLYDVENLDENYCGNCDIRRPIAPEKSFVTEWVKNNFSQGWADECEVALSNTPAKCFIALENGAIKGFACYDSTALGFFGPIGVLETERKSGLGRALLLKTLKQMKNDGYAYAIIGWAGPVKFFEKNVNAVLIEGSQPGIYKNIIKK